LFYDRAVTSRLPLPSLLSHLLVAFTIELDNEFEHRFPHRTTNHGSISGSVQAPWLVSLAMWLNCMQFLDEKGMTLRELERAARTKTNLKGMERWGYVSVAPDPNARRAKAGRSTWLIRPTRAGQKAQEVWRPLLGEIEERWRERFGKGKIEDLRQSLLAAIQRIDADLPDCMPILGYGLFSKERDFRASRGAVREQSRAATLSLATLLSRVLLAFAIEFEEKSKVSLAICANVLRLVGPEGIPVRDLPRLAGVAKEGIAVPVSFLTRHGLASVKAESPDSRVKLLVLTAKGQQARKEYGVLVSEIEEGWQARYAAGRLQRLRNSLEELLDKSGALFRGLELYPEGWRASRAKLETLPHFPMITHRGGFPDGS
jgi:DNA-binding MarR family transcriptional regulator